MTSVDRPHGPELGDPPLPAMLTQAELARRWRITTRTLDRWRVAGTGPAWLRINGRILYRTQDVLGFEQLRLRERQGGQPDGL